MKRRAILAIGLALSVLGLFVVAVGWRDVLSAIRQASLSTYLFAFVAMAGCLSFRALVWHRVLTVVDQRRPYWLVAGVFLAAIFAKYVMPYGQVTSGVGVAAVVSRYYDSAYEEGLAAVVSAGLLNYLPYYTFGAIGVGYYLYRYPPPVDLGVYAVLVGILVATIGLLLVVGWRRQDLVYSGLFGVGTLVRKAFVKVSPRIAERFGRENLERRLDGFYTTIDLVSRHRRAMVPAVLFAHLGWLGIATALYVTALSLSAPIPFGVALLCVALSKVGFLVPTPGGTGGVEITMAAVLYLLSPMGVSVATATAILFRFSTYWFTVLVGGGASIALTLVDPTPPEAA